MKVTLLLVLWSLSLLAHPTLEAASECTTTNCKIEDNCRCSSTTNPIADPDNPAPQLIAITISEAIDEAMYTNYWAPLFFERTNPDGNPIGLTFYVSHEYTDYALVQDLYLRGYEIGDYSITKNSNQTYWREASAKDLEDEFLGQRTIISTFANIPDSDIVGVRTPQLQLEGDVSIRAYLESHLQYDNSWPTSSEAHILPYTLDYPSSQDCTSMTCPTDSYKGFWVAPLTNIKGDDGTECNSLGGCLVEGDDEYYIASWLITELDRFRSGNRAPIILTLDSEWLQFTSDSYEGFEIFMNISREFGDVFLVSVQDVIEWVKNPVGLKEYRTPLHNDRKADCLRILCPLKDEEGQERYMRSCVPCPEVYPWKGNPLGKVL